MHNAGAIVEYIVASKVIGEESSFSIDKRAKLFFAKLLYISLEI